MSKAILSKMFILVASFASISTLFATETASCTPCEDTCGEVTQTTDTEEQASGSEQTTEQESSN